MSKLEQVFAELIASCGCAACHRYRIATASRVAYYAVKLEESMGKAR